METLAERPHSAADAPAATLRFVVFRSENWWVAIGLDPYLACQAATLEKLADEIERQIVGHRMIAERTGTEVFAGLGRAPEKYWRMYEDAERVWAPAIRRGTDRDLPRPEIGLYLPDAA